MRVANQDLPQFSAWRVSVAAVLTGILASYLSTAIWLAPFLDNPLVGSGYRHSVATWISGVMRDAPGAMLIGVPIAVVVTLLAAQSLENAGKTRLPDALLGGAIAGLLIGLIEFVAIDLLLWGLLSDLLTSFSPASSLAPATVGLKVVQQLIAVCLTGLAGAMCGVFARLIAGAPR